MSEPEPLWGGGVRTWIARQFTRVEDVVYVGLGLLLSGCAVALLVAGAIDFVSSLAGGRLPQNVIEILDRTLLILLVVEILYTVQVSFREHALVPEPFLIVGLIAATRRILILTAEFKDLLEKGAEAFRNGMIELGLLGFLILALVVSLVLLRKRQPAGEQTAVALRGEGAPPA
ncbi:MAG TPA: phosphate-starvation-inducible PsiE family protein [Thermoanaerobaculia bacterium]|nr:phosphate-starvation-inducible PsiE family protein [Thermoanaerobaculia bacterium]